MRKIKVLAALIATAAVLLQCKKKEQSEPVAYDPSLYGLEYGTFPTPNLHGNDPTAQGVKLGRMLFYEKKLSKNGTQSCGSCHIQSLGFSDSAQFSLGVEGLRGKRQAMSVFNTAWHTNEFFWDGRAHLLRDQSLKPIQDPLEMNETLNNVIAKLQAEQTYKDQFTRAFGNDSITAERMSLAMEQFMNTIISNQSKYDKFLAGQATLTASEEHGRKLFFKEYNQFIPSESGADCTHCHSGFNFTNNQYMNNGLDDDAGFTDKGREMVTGMASDRGKFKVPSLRNIALTAPYMHDGRFKTLEEVVEHYNSDIHSSATLDPAIAPTMATGLRLSATDKADLVAFLKTLTDSTMMTDSRFSDPF